MTHTMIWTFGSFAAFLLLVAVSKWAGGGHDGGQYRRLTEKNNESNEKTLHRLDQIGLQISELQTQLNGMERILKEVE